MLCADAVACVVARCCVHVLLVIQLSRSSQASPWLEHQDDFSGLTCIGYRAGVVAKSAKGRDAESAKDAEVR